MAMDESLLTGESVLTAAGGDGNGGGASGSGLAVALAFSGLLIDGESGTNINFAANIGTEQVAAGNNQVDPVGFPVSARTITRLRGCAPGGTGATGLTFTLYKDGAATGLTCTIASGAPAYTEAVDNNPAHAVTFTDGQRLDVRVSSPAPMGQNVGFSGTVEGPAGGDGEFPGFGGAPPAIAMGNTASAGTSGLVARTDQVNAQFLVADWAPTTVRTFLYDPVNGNDTNPGFSDAAGPYTPATQAKKTVNGLQAVFPRHFAGRQFRLILAAGAYAGTDLNQLLAGATGVGSGSVVRATGTNSSAGATAFADDASDRTYLGATTATGCNAGGYNPTAGSTTTSVSCQLNGGGAAGLPAEPASPLMWRIRFDAATTTVALRNVCRAVIAVTGGNTVTTDSALPAVPAVGDVFYLEMAGASFPSIRIGGASEQPIAGTAGISTGLQIAGIRATGAAIFGEGYFSFALFGAGSIVFRTSNLACGTTYYDPVGNVTLTVGGGLRSDGLCLVQSNEQVVFNTFACAGELSLLVYGQMTIKQGVVGAGVQLNTTPLTVIGTTLLRIIGPQDEGGIELQSAWLTSTDTISVVQITGCGGFPAIKADGVGNRLQLSSAYTGATGNNDVGLDLSAASASTVFLSSQPTVTGALGDVRLSDGSIVSWALCMAGITDPNGNVIYGSGASPLPAAQPDYVSAKLDLTVNNAVVDIVAARPGYVFLPARINCLVTDVSGAVSTAPTVQLLSGANAVAPSSAVAPSTTLFVKGGATGITLVTQSVGAPMLANQPLSMKVTNPATGTGGFAWKAVYVAVGTWVPLP